MEGKPRWIPEAGKVSKDRRVRRSQQLLREALLDLILEKPYQAITVQDIIDRADVGRSTFYAHFLDKDHLLKSGFENLQELFDKFELQPPGPHKSEFETVMFLFHHVKSFHPIYKALISKGGAEWITQEVQNLVTNMLRRHLKTQLENRKTPEDIPLEVLVQYRSSALMGLIKWWLDNDMPYSAEHMRDWFHHLAVLPLTE
jgi:AcrR family transcriptional regulator